MKETKEKPEWRKPKDPKGFRYSFNCCLNPNVWYYPLNSKSICGNCGYNWSNKL